MKNTETKHNGLHNRFWTLRYTLINVMYFAAFCTVHGYATVYLLSKGFTNTQVGIALAVSNILSVVGQPFVAALVDKYDALTNRRVLVADALIILIGSLLLLFINDSFVLIFSIYVLIYTVQFIGMSVLIAISFEYQNAGCEHKFGLSRGLGSASFAITSMIIGGIVAKNGTQLLLYLNIVFMICMAVITFFFRKDSDGKKTPLDNGCEIEPTNNIFEFIRTYPTFMLFLLGAALCFFSHNMLNDYLIQIIRNLGGDETQLGYATFLQAILELPVMAVMALVLKKISVKAVLAFSTIAFFIKVVIMYMATAMGAMYISQSFQLFAYAVFIPAAAYYSDSIMKAKDKVKGQAYINCAITLGGVFSGLICGPVLDKSGVSAMILLGIIVCGVGAAICVYALAKKKTIKNL